jgi:hypothetical protein
MNMKRILWLTCFLSGLSVYAQNNDSLIIRRLYTEVLTRGQCYPALEHLCKKIGGRLSGSPQAQQAVTYTAQQMYNYGFDTVYLQGVLVPHWVRGEKEAAHFSIGKKQNRVRICALGNSMATPAGGIKAPVIEVHHLSDIPKLGREKIQGKIVFYNRPLNPTYIHTGRAYGEAGDQRGNGAIVAAAYGAVGVVVRSLTLALDTFPHTGMMRYNDTVPFIPACAISTVDANLLSDALNSKDSASVEFYFRQTCSMLPDEISYNVIGEIRGTSKRDEIIVVGGHLDSWDNGEGAHDDGAGVVQSMEALRLFKALGIRPKRTMRCVLFMNEENGVRGGNHFADEVQRSHEKVIAAIESDAGGYTPRGMTVEDTATLQLFQKWIPLLSPYGIESFRKGWGGTDIGPLKKTGTLLIGYSPDSQRYFDIHHTAADTFDKINRRELELGAGAMASMLWLLSEYGVK